MDGPQGVERAVIVAEIERRGLILLWWWEKVLNSKSASKCRGKEDHDGDLVTGESASFVEKRSDVHVARRIVCGGRVGREKAWWQSAGTDRHRKCKLS